MAGNNQMVRNTKFVVWFAIVLHWVWGTLLLMGPAPLGVTAIATMTHWGVVTAQNLGIFYLLTSLLAAVGLAAPKYIGYIFICPQQIALFISAFGALSAMMTGTFADGVIRPTAFLVADQLPIVLLAVFHFLNVYAGCVINHWANQTAQGLHQ